MTEFKKHIRFDGRMVIVGFGSIGQGVRPLFLRHIEMSAKQITVVTADEAGRAEAEEYGIKEFRVEPITRDNMDSVLGPLVTALGKVSVVMIARAASDHEISERPASTAGRCWGSAWAAAASTVAATVAVP